MADAPSGSSAPSAPSDFIRRIIADDLRTGKHDHILTRFPPEPNGYLHIGHAKSICLNFGSSLEVGGVCNLRFDDTNPEKEEQEYIDSITRDVRWLGFDWADRLFFASDYFEKVYECAEELIRKGLAYVDSLSAEEMREYRGTLTQPGRESPDRHRPVEENLRLFREMRAGVHPEGKYVLRAKIDMAAPNINLRDPVLYRVKFATHHHVGDAWCLYPMYDFTHPISDALEGITHSVCTLEFEDHRPLYDWVVDHLDLGCKPRQIEFSRLSLEYTVMSKRKLNLLVKEGLVSGWDDPRLPTLAGMRRRGYPPEAIREFCARIGVSKADNRVEVGQLESCVREALDASSPRAMAVLRPLKVVIETLPEGHLDRLTLGNHPKRPELGQRSVPLTRDLFIEADDFAEISPKGFKRLVPDGEVRLRGGYVIRCREVVKNEAGEVVELRCTHDPATLGADPVGRKVRGVIHWVSADRSLPASIRLYDRLFLRPDPEEEGQDFLTMLNPASLETVTGRVEPSLADAPPEARFQFERVGYFCVDQDSRPGALVFNRTVTLRDSWAGGN
ncbi:MAG: glutamine--tRNA ligase/YqeY domain fusion protein [Magnetococcales bacterium]|nr:glutamine--tRNA ligase/YqeY domain fusion protein [Magnetococcales bacterium]